MDLCRE
ncbi:hypothetical protein Celaphus_00002733 [Cervus elaphus hippelaphus]|nr:hypothetical protein Celaphus_00002733 [Cervus elaphus hippelaphus]